MVKFYKNNDYNGFSAGLRYEKKDIGFLSNGTVGDGGYPQLGKAGAGEWCLKMVVSACQETDEARNGASSLASNPRKYREKKYKRGERRSPSSGRTFQ